MINDFSNEYAFLSNFYPVNIVFDGITYPTLEHAYHAAKTLDPQERLLVRNCPTPAESKRMGRKVTMRADWEAIKISVMLNLLRKKFAQKELKEKLLATGDEELAEGNWWGDTFWGVYNGVGQNHLGKLLMQVREEIK